MAKRWKYWCPNKCGKQVVHWKRQHNGINQIKALFRCSICGWIGYKKELKKNE